MKKIIPFIVVCLLFALPARAEVFVWNDPQGDISLSFPDHWLRQAQFNPAQSLFISHPQFSDMAHCVMARQEKADPLLNARVVLDQMHNRGFLNASIMAHRDNIAWAGRAATMTHIAYTATMNGRSAAMKAVQYTTRIKGDMVSLRCAAEASRFDAHMPLFAGVAGSVRSSITATPFANGHYRDFMQEHVYLFHDRQRRAVSRY